MMSKKEFIELVELRTKLASVFPFLTALSQFEQFQKLPSTSRHRNSNVRSSYSKFFIWEKRDSKSD